MCTKVFQTLQPTCFGTKHSPLHYLQENSQKYTFMDLKSYLFFKKLKYASANKQKMSFLPISQVYKTVSLI